MTKIGIFGGAFDPPHYGHINLAKATFKELKLKKMLIIPTKKSPHKTGSGVSYDARMEMARLAFDGLDGFEVSDLERHLSGISYTINTVRTLKEMYPKDTQFFLIIGGDMLFYFKKWYRYEALLKECKVVAAARHNDEYVDMLEFANEMGYVKVLNLPVTEVSSSEIREKIKSGEPTDELLPPAVRDYIDKNSLYMG